MYIYLKIYCLIAFVNGWFVVRYLCYLNNKCTVVNRKILFIVVMKGYIDRLC